MALRAVIFDYGNVLVRWDPRFLYRKLFADEAEMERFLSEVLTPAWHYENDAGALMADTLPALIAQHPRYEPEIRAWGARYTETITGEIEGSIALLDRLAARGVPLGLLTNMPADQQEACFVHSTRLHLFQALVVSGVEKLAKPQRAIYELALKRLGAKAEETLFIDDSARNVEGAAAAGLAAHLFTTPEALAEKLAQEGLLG